MVLSVLRMVIKELSDTLFWIVSNLRDTSLGCLRLSLLINWFKTIKMTVYSWQLIFRYVFMMILACIAVDGGEENASFLPCYRGFERVSLGWNLGRGHNFFAFQNRKKTHQIWKWLFFVLIGYRLIKAIKKWWQLQVSYTWLNKYADKYARWEFSFLTR